MRENRKILVLAGTACMAIVSIACTGSSNTAPNAKPVVRTENTTAAAPLSNPAPTPGQVPESLTAAGEFGENIYDAVKAGDWKTGRAKFTELKSDSEKVNALKIGSTEFAATLAKLESAVAANDKSATLENANLITFEAANLTAKYNPPVPIEVVKLDFYGRELEIWSQAKDDAKLQETAKMIRQNWDAVKPKIEAKGGTKQAAVFEALVIKTDAAKTPAEFAKLATPILNEVDNLEKVFG